MSHRLDRRSFLTALGLSGAAAALPATPPPPPARPSQPAATKPRYALVSHARADMGGTGEIVTFRVDGSTWTRIESTSFTPHPDAMANHPALPILYTASHRSIDQSDPRGRVTALYNDPRHTASLERFIHHGDWFHDLGSQPMSLAARYPEAIAVAPDGSRLLVSEPHEGHLNVFPLASDGALGPLQHVLKQVGTSVEGTHLAPRPHSILFHPDSHVAWTTDDGVDRLNLLAFHAEAPRITQTLSFGRATGAGHLALHPRRELLLVSLTHSGSIAVVPVHPATGGPSAPLATLQLSHDCSAGPIYIGSTGDLIYVASRQTPKNSRPPGAFLPHPLNLSTVHTLHLSRSGRLRELARTEVPSIQRLRQISSHGSQLVLLGSGGVVTFSLDQRTGVPLTDSVTTFEPWLEATGVVFRDA